MQYNIGTCGWSYKEWHEKFYPKGTKDELSFYASRFNAVEIDSTWYRLPSTQMVQSWYMRTPEGFLFCPKLLGEITHERQLQHADELVTAFLNSIRLLEDKLGSIVIQLSPQFTSDQWSVLQSFLMNLPNEFRYAIEFRHRSWLQENTTLAFLTDLRMGLVMAHHPWYPRFEVATTDFTYLRLMGRHGAPPNAMSQQMQDEALQKWANTIRALSVDRAFIFANNSFGGFSPDTVTRLQLLLET